MSGGRRSLSIALPESDPRSARILAWLEEQPTGVDRSAAIRQALVERMELAARLDAIVARLDVIAAAGIAPAPAPAPVDDAALGTLLAGFD
jgi:hypothetical protein